MAEGEGTVEGTQGTGAGTGQDTQSTTPPAWVAQLPVDLKANEVFTKYPTLRDLGKSHIEVLGKIKELDGMTAKIGELEGKLSNAIPKLPENPTKEQLDAYYTALGRPAKPEDYKFEPDEGVEHIPEVLDWAQKTFWKYGLSQEVAQGIQREWDQFQKGVEQEEEKLVQTEVEENQKRFRGLFKTDDEYKTALEMNNRYWKKITGEDLPTFVDGFTLIKFIHEHAKRYGEDQSLPGSQTRSTSDQRPRMLYDRTPAHQK